MFKKIVSSIVGDPNKKIINNLRPTVSIVNEMEPALQGLPDEALRERTAILKERVASGESLDDVLPEAFALVREASRRTIALRPYDVQIMGGMLLFDGEVVEMRTGEGKTLVATLPLYLNALSGRGAHLVTVNEYLARRDGGWMGKIFHLLGMSVGVIGPLQFSALFDPEYVNPGAELEDERLVHWRPSTRRQAYEADITYGISSEFGFDYLRDNMAVRQDQLVQRDLHFAVIDEVDNILIDEARTPLIISGPAARSGKDYVRFAEYVRRLRPNTADEDEDPNGHYDIDEKSRSISLTEPGIAEVEKRIEEIDPDAGDNLYDPRFYHLTYYLDNALRAQYLFKRDVDYVVQGDEVVIVDDFTGRLMPGRRYSDGLHEAIEAKEGVNVKRETVTVGTITLQNYFRLYEKLAGMTGTALTDAEEFDKIYELGVTPLPTNVEYIVDTGQMGLEARREKIDGAEATVYVKPLTNEPVFYKRVDFPDQVYANLSAKDQAILNEIKSVHHTGRPILVGTTSVEHSETIHNYLEREKISHAVLNAKIHQSEALIVAQAGRRGAVTISTNMAGRGTDILLGGNAEGLAAEALENEMFDRPMLVQLALKLLSEGEEAARDTARKSSKLTEDLADALVETKVRFTEAMDEIDQVQIVGHLARALQEPYGIDYNDLLEVLRRVRTGELAEARVYVEGLDKDVALVDDIMRRWSDLVRFQNIQADDNQVAQFLAEQTFEHHYKARAALIRAVLGDRPDEARRLVDTIPGLAVHHIERIEQLREQAKADKAEIWQLGGLHVVGSERHESRRIDNQLRGRAARQGDPGSSRFFLSLEDDLMRRFGGERLKGFMTRTNIPDDMPIESGLLDRIIESSQERIEGYNFDMRKNIVEYDDVMNKQRQAIYGERREILMGEDFDLDRKVDAAFDQAIEELIDHYVNDYSGFIRAEVERVVQDFTTDATNTVNVVAVLRRVGSLLPLMSELDREELESMSPDRLTVKLIALAHEQERQGTNLLQLLQAMGRFLPLVPPVPNLGALATHKGGQVQTRERLRADYLAQVDSLFTEFLADYADKADRDAIWSEAEAEINQAFSRFSIDGLSIKNMVERQTHFRDSVDAVLRELLLQSLAALDAEQLAEALQSYIDKQQAKWREHIGETEYRNYEQLLLLQAIDREWRDYLTAMDDLRREIGLQAFGQRDPKIEYKKRSFEMFGDMRKNIDRDIADRFFRDISGHQSFVQQQQQQVIYQEQSQDAGYQTVKRERGKGTELRKDSPDVGRNDPCPCGSGRKYKNCHGRPGVATAAAGNGQTAQPTVGKKKPQQKKKARR
ncbi:MAG: preprotein translocase subunit SecA [Candidatus Promineofilum sp.]|nr:preprotein translocase subunit SecA [Promineifilum sp.]